MSEVISIHAAGRRDEPIVAGPAAGERLNRPRHDRDRGACRTIQRGGRSFDVYSSDDTNVIAIRGPWTDGTPAA